MSGSFRHIYSGRVFRYTIHQDVLSGLFYANLLCPFHDYGQGVTCAEALASLKIALNVRMRKNEGAWRVCSMMQAKKPQLTHRHNADTLSAPLQVAAYTR